MTTSTRERTAIHESGHCVSAWALGHEVGLVQITDGAGAVVLSRFSPQPAPLGDLVWGLSGIAAELIGTGSYDVDGARRDIASAARSAYAAIDTRDLDASAAIAAVDDGVRILDHSYSVSNAGRQGRK